MTHRHVPRHYPRQLRIESVRISSDEIRSGMSHLIHSVMSHVTMQSPVPRCACDKLDHAHRAHRYQHGGLRDTSARWHGSTIGCDDLERVTMEVDRMVIHRTQVAEPNADAVANLGNERLGRRKRLAVERENVEVVHRERIS